MNIALLTGIYLCVLCSCTNDNETTKADQIIATGKMPNIAKDASENVHMVYGSGDSIMYTSSMDKGKTFSAPMLVSILPHLAASHTRGPQIAASNSGLTIIAGNNAGDIFSYIKPVNGKWQQTGRVNDVDTIAKEGLMALGADKENTFAVWLDLRGNNQNKIYGAKSADGGKTWAANSLVYASPDTTVCECCKPSVLVNDNNVYVMFRNWLNGNRDMYIARSTDAGNSFKKAEKLGNGAWNLNACPMDGGGLAINDKGEINTVWRRDKRIYTAKQGTPEMELGEGKGCTIETINNQNVYAWTENGEIVLLKPGQQKQVIGKGTQPLLKAVDAKHLVCIYENDSRIHAYMVAL